MPACARWGKKFSGFSFGSTAPTECRECRRAFPQIAAQRSSSTPVALTGDELLLLGGDPPVVTRAIIAIDVLIFLAMVISGISWTEPGYLDLVRWGADFSPLTLSGEWWRLLTSTFIHIGIVHIALNMWCLWSLGPVLERLMGWRAYLLTYIVSGLAGSEASLFWRPWGGGAGASGAIFGVAGAFFSFLLLKKAPISPEFAKKRLKSVAIFIFYNLFLGAAALRVNNAAHIGGLIAGIILGAVLPCVYSRGEESGASSVPSLGDSSGEQSQVRRLVAVGFVSVLVLVGVAGAIAKHNASIAEYGKAVSLIQEHNAERAIPHLQSAISKDPKNVIALEMLGILLLDRNNPAEAWIPLRKAVDFDRNDLALRHNLALAFIGAGFSEYASEEIAWARKRQGEDQASANFILGLASYRDRNYPDAVKYLRLAIGNRKDFFEAQNLLGIVYSAMGDRDEARKLYSAVLAQHPGDAVALGGMEILAAISEGPIPQDQLPRFVIPYSKLVVKSDYWPLFP
jgi:rhomboid protease GluP